jgi:signal-transduction protein with cAMP-binding, CBS, and nucleotidyltransferase domain
MNAQKASAAIVTEREKVVGMLSDRGLLRKFVPLNKRPDEVRIGELMVPIMRVSPDTSTKTAAKMLVRSGFTRVGVFKEDKFLGWVTLTDLAREFSKGGMRDMLRIHTDEPESRDVLCPHCHAGFLEKIVTREGAVGSWKCSSCGFTL